MGDGLGDTDDDDGGAQAVAGSGEPPGSETHAGADTGTCGTTCAHGTTRADAPARAAHDATYADIPVGAAPGNDATFCAKANSGADKRDAAANPHR